MLLLPAVELAKGLQHNTAAHHAPHPYGCVCTSSACAPRRYNRRYKHGARVFRKPAVSPCTAPTTPQGNVRMTRRLMKEAKR